MEPVTGASSGEAIEMSNTELPLPTITKDSDVPPEYTSEVVPLNADKAVENDTPPSSPNTCCDVKTSVEHRAKTKGRLRQQLQKRRHQLTSSSEVKEKSTITSPDKNKSLPPSHTGSQVYSLLRLFAHNIFNC